MGGGCDQLSLSSPFAKRERAEYMNPSHETFFSTEKCLMNVNGEWLNWYYEKKFFIENQPGWQNEYSQKWFPTGFLFSMLARRL